MELYRRGPYPGVGNRASLWSCGAAHGAGSRRGAMATLAYVALGSNLGDRLGNLQRAVRLIGEVPGTRVLRTSSVYETAPREVEDQPEFLNAVAEVETERGPRQLLDALLAIEARLGRERRVKYGPRSIDLDVLLYGDEEIHEPGLDVPHPKMLERAFVIVPLAELEPARVTPSGQKLRELARELRRHQRVRAIYGPDWPRPMPAR